MQKKESERFSLSSFREDPDGELRMNRGVLFAVLGTETAVLIIAAYFALANKERSRNQPSRRFK